MLKTSACLPIKVICTGRVTIKLFRIKTECDVEYRSTIECHAKPDEALTLGEMRMVEDLIRESIRDAEAAAANELNLKKLSLFPKSNSD